VGAAQPQAEKATSLAGNAGMLLYHKKPVYMVGPPGSLMPEYAVGRCYVRGGVLCDQAMPSNITKHAAFKQCQPDDEACRCSSDGMSGDVATGVAGCADHGESNLTSPGRTY
jgi:hypothetical protein